MGVAVRYGKLGEVAEKLEGVAVGRLDHLIHWAYLRGVADALALSMPHGAIPFQVLDAAMRAQLKTAPDDLQGRLNLATVWAEQNPDFKPTKRQRVSFTEDWGVGWPIATNAQSPAAAREVVEQIGSL